MGSMADYEAEAARSRAVLASNPDLKEVIRHATLAANSHNTQPWKFAAEESAVRILADQARRTAIVDPDDHHLYASLGCAAENLVIAAAATGRSSAIDLAKIGQGEVRINLGAAAPATGDLLAAIPQRQCTRSIYSGETVSADQIALLQQAGTEQGVTTLIFTGKPKLEQILELILEGNKVQVSDKAFVAELNSWLRFNPAAALKTKDGLFSATSGNPQLPSWLGSMMFPCVFSEAGERDRIAAQVRSSSGVAVFISEKNERPNWFNAGRAYERFALQATALGIRNALLNQPVEVAATRQQFAGWLALPDARPSLVARFGPAPPMPMSLRRPVDEVLV
jgi:hypothetical protein